MGQIHGGNAYLTGGTQVHVPGTRHKCQHLRHEKILNGYENSNTCIVVGSLSVTTNFVISDVLRCAMTSGDSRVVIRISYNNKEYNVIINPLHTVST